MSWDCVASWECVRKYSCGVWQRAPWLAVSQSGHHYHRYICFASKRLVIKHYMLVIFLPVIHHILPHAPLKRRSRVLFLSVSVGVRMRICLSAHNNWKKPLIRIGVIDRNISCGAPRVSWILVRCDLDFWPWELFSYIWVAIFKINGSLRRVYAP